MIWVGTFKPRDRFSGRYVVIDQPTEDLARKKMLDWFGKNWENIYSEAEWKSPAVETRLKREDYEALTIDDYKKELERSGRIKYKTIKM